MREFILPFKPEELLAQPADDRLWASNLPDVETWSSEEINSSLDKLIRRLLATHGSAIAEDEYFSLLFALLQAWPRLDDGIRLRTADLLVDVAQRLTAQSAHVQKQSKKSDAVVASARTAAKVAVFYMRWAAERLFRKNQVMEPRRPKGRGKGSGKKGGGPQELAGEELKDAQKNLDRQRSMLLSSLLQLMNKNSMPWMWTTDPVAWQQVSERVSDAGFLALDLPDALKHRETRQAALGCIAEPLMQEGHQHSNLLVATVSKLAHALRGGEQAAPFVADVLLLASSTSLPRLFIVDLTQHCTGPELTSQSMFQRSLGQFLTAVAERLPHVVLANISVLLPLLDVDCYPLRSAIVESIGHLLTSEGKKIKRSAVALVQPVPGGGENPDNMQTDDQAADKGEVAGEEQDRAGDGAPGVFTLAEATRKDLLETLMARTLDKTVWVRVRSMQTLTNLAQSKRGSVLPATHWPDALQIGIRRMQDTASSARKAAMQLVRALIATHPYGPALVGSGNERAKITNLLREVMERMKKLDREEAAEEAAAGNAELEVEEGAEEATQGDDLPAKRRRVGKKAGESASEEVERCLAEEIGTALEANAESRLQQREALKRMLDCYTQRLKFVEMLDSAEARLRVLLSSRVPTDVIEAINVVVELRLRDMPVAAKAFNQVLGLVWSRHSPVKEAAVEAFRRMHLDGQDVRSAVQAILGMYKEGLGRNNSSPWTYTHLASVQELIQQATEQKHVDPDKALPHLLSALQSPSDCHEALRAMAAIGVAAPDTVLKALPGLSEALERSTKNGDGNASLQLERVSLVCHLLLRLHSCQRQSVKPADAARFASMSEICTFTVLKHLCEERIVPQWFNAAQSAMDLSFQLSSSATADSPGIECCPDKFWELMLERILQKVTAGRADGGAASDGTQPVLKDAAKDEDVEPVGNSDEMVGAADVSDGDLQMVQAPAEGARTTSTQLGCVIFLSGHLAMRMLVYLEKLQAALKKKRMTEEDARIAEKREKSKKQRKSKAGEGEETAAQEAASMGMAGQEEREADAFHDLAEHAILYGQTSLLNRVKPMVLSGLLEAKHHKDPVLRRAAAISLCKFMTVSKRFCEEHLQLLFSILFPKCSSASLLKEQGAGEEETQADSNIGHRSLLEDLTLRQSLLVAVGDLLFRHPNTVEPWTERLYAALGGGDAADEGNDDLRLTALLVLTHLVLNDMMKPRAVLLTRALWLTACTHERTARVARLLFQELSKKTTNVLYNLAPEVIARLPEHAGSATGVQGGPQDRVQWFMQFIEKDKHIEGLIEKLSVRLAQAADRSGKAHASAKTATQGTTESDDAVVSCLAHALGAMNYSERCLMRLHDIVVIRKALHVPLAYHEVVRESILAVVEKARRLKGGAGGKSAAGDAAAPAEAPPAPPAADGGAGGGGQKGGGLSAAALAALDAIEELVTALAQGQQEDEGQEEG